MAKIRVAAEICIEGATPEMVVAVIKRCIIDPPEEITIAHQVFPGSYGSYRSTLEIVMEVEEDLLDDVPKEVMDGIRL